MTTTTNIDLIVDAIDWDAAAIGRPSDPTDPPTAADRDPDLYDFVSQAAACIPDPKTGCVSRKPWHSIKPA